MLAIAFSKMESIVLCEDTRERGVCETLVRLERLFIERESKRFYREADEWQR